MLWTSHIRSLFARPMRQYLDREGKGKNKQTFENTHSEHLPNLYFLKYIQNKTPTKHILTKNTINQNTCQRHYERFIKNAMHKKPVESIMLKTNKYTRVNQNKQTQKKQTNTKRQTNTKSQTNTQRKDKHAKTNTQRQTRKDKHAKTNTQRQTNSQKQTDILRKHPKL